MTKDLLISLPIAFILLGIQEAIIKPIAIAFTNRWKREILKALPSVFQHLDLMLPIWLKDKNPQQMEAAILELFALHSDEFDRWTEREKNQAVREVIDRYDLLAAAARVDHKN